jgi:uncharacterized protein (TIGR02001 family)
MLNCSESKTFPQRLKDTNMRNLHKALVIAGLATLPFAPGFAQAQTPAAPAAAEPAKPAEPESPHTFAWKIAAYSEYEYRGIDQTAGKVAGQFNGDYSHSSGLYLGTFISNIKWLEILSQTLDPPFNSNARIEWDIYGGYKFEAVKDVTVDVGFLTYIYPSSGGFNPSPDTTELYIGAGYGPISAKYSYAVTDTFGVANSKGSQYIEANLAWEVIEHLTITGTIARQAFQNNSALSYNVWKAGAIYDFGHGINAGLYYKDTNANEALYTYNGRYWGKGLAVGFVSWTF